MPIPFEIADRMMHAARLKNHSALAADLGITPQALSNYKRRGDFPPGLVMGFAAKHGLSVDGLINGTRVEPALQLQGPNKINIELTLEEANYVYKLLQVLRTSGLGQVFRHSLDALVEAQDRGALHV